MSCSGCYDSSVFHSTYACGNSSNGYFCVYSDVRLKKGVETIKNAITKIMEIEAVEYDWNKKLPPQVYEFFRYKQKLHAIGLIAQNVRLYFPEAVIINPDGYYSIDYEKLNAVLVEGIKEQSLFIEDIDKELNYIESKLS
jgi:Chaperone of endosialidase